MHMKYNNREKMSKGQDCKSTGESYKGVQSKTWTVT